MRDFTVNSYTIAHYAKDYIATSLQSVYPAVDKSLIFYTPHPSHGHAVDVKPIESRQDIQDAILEYPAITDKVLWYETDIWQEGQQRDYALSVASASAQLIAVVDYDEVWGNGVLERVLEHVWQANSARRWLLNFSRHFWRSFNWAATDDNWPVRIIDTRHSEGVAYIPKELGEVWHFGYAIETKTLLYKLAIHGHRDELRPNWFEEKWQAWPPVDDCHPTNGRKENGEGWWNPEPFDKWQLPEIMYSHPFFNLERIE